MKKRFSLGLAVLFCVVMSFLALNCETGLGPAVDVEKPTLSISYPPANSVVRDTFILAGPCSDDQGVKRIEVTILKDNKPFAGPFDAELDEEGTSWRIMLNKATESGARALAPLETTKEYELKDGTYVISVQAFDKAGRQSDKITNSYEIDNTAPVLLLNKPLGVFDDKPTSYGRALRFAGDASDDHDLSLSLYLQEYDKPLKEGGDLAPIGELKALENLNVSSMSSDAPLIVAKYFTNPKNEDEIELTNRYKYIYGEPGPLGKNKDKFFYAGIRLYDIAKVYQNPEETENTSLGNTTDTYFVYSENLTNVLTKYGTDGIKAGDLKRILNGTDTTYADQPEVISAVRAALEVEKNYVKCVEPTDVAITSNIFKLNPDNNPTWSIGGFAWKGNGYGDPEKGGVRPYAEGNSLTLSLMPNDDKDYIRPRYVSLYIQKYKLESGKFVKDESSPRITIIEGADPNAAEIVIPETCFDEEQTNETASKNTQVNQEDHGINPNEYYKFELEGQDAAGNDYVPDNGADDNGEENGYGFVVSAAKTSSTISIVERKYGNEASVKCEDGDYFKFSRLDDGLTVIGTLFEENKDMDATDPFTCDITITDIATGEKVETISIPKKQITCKNRTKQGEETTLDWTVKVTSADLKETYTDGNYKFFFKFKSKNANAIEAVKELTLIGDNKKPMLSVTNGELLKTSPEKRLVTEKSLGSYSEDDKGNPLFSLKGKWSDESGSGTKKLYCYYSKEGVPYNGAPALTLSSYDETYLTDLGWEKISIDDAPETKKSANWMKDFAFVEGETHYFAVFAIDDVGNVSDIISYSNVIFDGAAPIITFDDSNFKATTNQLDGTFALSGTITDTYGLHKIKLTEPEAINVEIKNNIIDFTATLNGEPQTLTPTIERVDDKKYTWKLNISGNGSEGLWNISAIAKDKVGRSSTKWTCPDITFDCTKPERTALSIGGKDGTLLVDTTKQWFKSTALKVTGNYKEALSGISAIYYWANPDGTEVINGDLDKVSGSFGAKKADDFDTTKSWAINETITSGLKTGENIVNFIVVDKAGNVSESAGPYYLYIDTQMPTIVPYDSKKTEYANGALDKSYNGTVSDDASGVVNFSFELDDKTNNKIVIDTTSGATISPELENIKSTDEITITNAAGDKIVLGKQTEVTSGTEKVYERTWTVTLTAASLKELKDGTWSANGHAFDKSGNDSGQMRLFSITIDKTVPTGEIAQPSNDAIVNKEFNIQGNANDNGELKSVTLTYGVDDGDAETKFDPVLEFTENGAYNWATTTAINSEKAFGTLTYKDPWRNDAGATKSFASEDSATVTIKATVLDKADNSSNDQTDDDEKKKLVTTFYVNQHSDRPIINVTSIAQKGQIAKYATTLSGTVQDDDSNGTAIVAEFIATSTPLKFENGKLKKPDSIETEFVQSTGDWTFTPKNSDDGMKDVYFYIVDNAGTEFYSVASREDELKPYLAFMGKTEDRTTLDEKFEFGIDNTPPSIEETLAFYSGTTTYGTDNEELSDTGTVYFGGTKRNHIKLQFTAKDANGIAKLDAVVYDTKGAPKSTYKYDFATDATGNNGTATQTGAANEKKTAVWELDLGELKEASWEDGSYSVSLTVTDKSGITSSKKYLFATDFTAPEVNMTSPAESTIIIASANIKANFTDYGAGMDGGAKWIIPTLAQNANETARNAIDDGDWNDASLTLNKELDWKAISRYSNTTASTGYATKITEGDKGKLKVPVLFKVADKLGNSKIVEKTITIDPDASKAKADIVYPTDEAKVSSSLTLSGTASVDEGKVKEVRVKIDADGDGDFDKDDYRILSGAAIATDIEKFLEKVIKSNTPDTQTEYLKVLNEDGWKTFAGEKPVDSGTASIKRLVGDETDWYIIADGTNSWKLTLDMSLFAYTYSKYSKGDENPEVNFMAVAWAEQENIDASTSKRTYSGYEYNVDGDETKTEHIRAWPATTDTSAEAKAAGTAKFAVTVDTGVPTITGLKIVQYSDAALTTTTISRAYEAGMYVSPKVGTNVWYLVATIGDETALASYKVSSVDKSGRYLEFKDNKSNDDATFKSALTSAGTGGLKTYTLKIPLTSNTTKDGQFYLAIEPTDKTGKTGQQYVSIFTDGTAPVMARESDTKKANAAPGDTNSAVRFTDSLSQILGENALIENTDGVFEFGGTFEEDGGSDLAYLAFWFERQPRSTGYTLNEKRVYNPMIAHGTPISNVYKNQTKLEDTKTDGKLYINSEGLAVVEMAATRGTDASGKSTITVTKNNNIRQGGLVKIDGFYYMITNNDNGVLTLDKTIDPGSTSKVEVVYAQVVNRKGRETDENGSIATDDGTKDGDGMNETLKVKGSMYTWRAELDSKNIPDGPIIVHVTAIDGAGNLEQGSLKTMVANNRPRVTRVMVGTDWNADGYFKVGDGVKNINNVADTTTATESGTEFGEFVYYSTIDRALDDSNLSGTAREDAMAKAVVTLKGGGTFIVSNRLCVIPRFTGGNGTTGLTYGWEVLDEDKTQTKGGTATLRRDNAGQVDVDKDTVTDGKLCLSGDSTEVSSLIQEGNKYGGLILKNSELEPHESWTKTSQKVKYLNFTFWDKTDETVQGEDSLWALVKLPCYINVVDDVAPKAYIKPFYWTSWEDSSTYIDKDTGLPDGHIDSLEEDLEENNKGKVNPKVSGTVYIAGIAEDETRLKEIYVHQPGTTSGIEGTKYTIAKYVGGKWVAQTAELPGHWKTDSIKIEETRAPGQKGHAVEYKVAIDMTSWGVGTDFDVFATAEDGSANASKTKDGASYAAQTTEDALTNHYIMDFVPYIKSITENGEDAPRSRLGRYPVRAGDKIRINGMNFASTATYKVNFYKTGTNGKPDTEQNVGTADQTPSSTGDGYIVVTAPNYSCWVEVNVDNEDAPNNSNDNTVGYNVQKGKFRLNKEETRMEAKDDVPGADFWTDDCYLSVWNVGTTFDDSPNPIKGSIERATEPTTKYVKKQRNGNNYNNKGYIPDGTLFGVWGGENNMVWDEILTAAADLKGRGESISPKSSGAFKSPPSQTDIVVVNGTTKGGTTGGDQVFYAILDDGWSDAETFGQGLLLIRDGIGSKGDSSANEFYAIELTKTDLQRDQFQNPKVAGYYGTASATGYTTNSYHTYVSYYDKYTKCLKYGRVEWQDKADISANASEMVVASGKRCANASDSIVVDGTDTVGEGDDVGQWSDIKIIDQKPVIIYYDKTNKQLKYATADASIPTSWTKGALNKPAGSDFGRYVSIEVDAGKNIHIVAQDANNGILYYGCTASLGSTITWHKVDATSSVGRWTDIKLEDPSKSGYAAKPVVTYMDAAYLNTTKAVKIAYIEDTTNGTWEAMTDPATYEASDMKLSLVAKPREKDATSYSRYAIGINSTEFAVDFLRGED